MVERICDLVDQMFPEKISRRRLITFVTDRPGHDFRYAVDPSRIESELGWRPHESFDSGLVTTINWYINNRFWWEPIQKNIYNGERLGLELVKA